MLRRRAIYVIAMLTLLGVLVDAGIRAASAARDLRQAEQLVDEAAAMLTDGRLAEARESLEQAKRLSFRSSASLHKSVGLGVARSLPLLSSNLRSIDQSLEAVTTIIHGGSQILSESEQLQGEDGRLEVSLSDGSLPLSQVQAAERQVSRLADRLVLLDRSRSERFLLPVISEFESAVEAEVHSRREQLTVLSEGLQLLLELAGANGPRRYLLAVANTAEMRGSGGMILNYGVLEGTDGTISLTDFGRIDELAIDTPVSSDLVPPDYAQRWAGFEPFRRFRQANLAGDFTVVAPVLEAMYTAATDRPVHGVIQVDPAGLAALLDGVGPVTVPELGVVTGENVVPLTLNEAYFRFPGVEDRSDVLGDVAEAAFRRLVEGEIPSLRTLASRLAEAVDARHVIVHGTTASLQERVVAFGADGAYPDVEDGIDHLALTAQNLSGNKLDYYLDTHLAVSGERLPGEIGDLSVKITLTNTAPVGVTSPRYIFGPSTDQRLPAGVLRSLVTLYLPPGASVAASGGDTPIEPLSTGTEDARPYASATFDLPAGSSRTFDLRLRLAPRDSGPYEMLMTPSAHVRPTTAHIDIDTGDARAQADIALDRTWAVVAGDPPTHVMAPLYR